MRLYHGPGNGLPDIFQIDAAELGIGGERAAESPPRRAREGNPG